MILTNCTSYFVNYQFDQNSLQTSFHTNHHHKTSHFVLDEEDPDEHVIRYWGTTIQFSKISELWLYRDISQVSLINTGTIKSLDNDQLSEKLQEAVRHDISGQQSE